MNWSSGLSSVVFQRRRLTINVAPTPPKHAPLQPGRLIKLALLPKGVCTGWCLNQTQLFPSPEFLLRKLLFQFLSCCVLVSSQKRRAQSFPMILFCSRASSDLPFEEWMTSSCVTHLCAIWAAGHWLSTRGENSFVSDCKWLAIIHFKA